MGKGLGHVGRAITEVFAEEPDLALSVDDLCMCVYDLDWGDIEKKHRVAVLRTVKTLPWLRPWQCGMFGGGHLLFYTADNVLAFGMARLRGDDYQGFRQPIQSDDALRARLEPGGDHHHLIVPGGAWHRHVEMYVAERDGDTERLQELQREQDRDIASIGERINGAASRLNPPTSDQAAERCASMFEREGLTTKAEKARAILKLLAMSDIAPDEVEGLSQQTN